MISENYFLKFEIGDLWAQLQEQPRVCHCHATNMQNHFCGDALINLIDRMAQGASPRTPSRRTAACMPRPCNEFAKPLLWRHSGQSH